MYKVVTKEDTIRIPAEYIRKDKSLNEHIDRLAASAFEGRFDDNNRFVLVTSNHEPIDRGRIIHGDGAITKESVSMQFYSALMTTRLLKVQFQKSMTSAHS